MTKEKFPRPKIYLDVRLCKIIYEAYQKEAYQHNFEPIPPFETRYNGALESLTESIKIKANLQSLDIVEVAANYYVRLARGQVFFNANKRMALMLTAQFLILNDFEFQKGVYLGPLTPAIVSTSEISRDEVIDLITPFFKKIIKKR